MVPKIPSMMAGGRSNNAPIVDAYVMAVSGIMWTITALPIRENATHDITHPNIIRSPKPKPPPNSPAMLPFDMAITAPKTEIGTPSNLIKPSRSRKMRLANTATKTGLLAMIIEARLASTD